jgi:hypothetical protein
VHSKDEHFDGLEEPAADTTEESTQEEATPSQDEVQESSSQGTDQREGGDGFGTRTMNRL